MNMKENVRNASITGARLSVKAPHGLHSELKRLAHQDGTSIPRAIRKAVASYIQSAERRRQLEGRP